MKTGSPKLSGVKDKNPHPELCRPDCPHVTGRSGTDHDKVPLLRRINKQCPITPQKRDATFPDNSTIIISDRPNLRKPSHSTTLKRTLFRNRGAPPHNTQMPKFRAPRLTMLPTSPKIDFAGWSSSVARRAHNPKVTGSNPVPATILPHSPLKDLIFPR